MMTLLEEYSERSQAIKELEAKRQELLSKGKTDDANNLYEQLKGLEAQNIENLLSQRELRYKVIDDILDLGNYGKNVRTLQHEIQRNKLIASGIQSDSKDMEIHFHTKWREGELVAHSLFLVWKIR